MNPTHIAACIEACHHCANACSHCAAACLSEPHVQQMTRCIALDLDCADLCRTSAALMARGSGHAAALCLVCARACDACGAECAQHAHEHCQACASACRQCARACRQMSEAA